MMFFDCSVLCADVMSIPVTPTDVDNITSIEIKNAWYDDLYATKDVESNYINDMIIPEEWNFDTILHAKFDGDLVAGNTDFTLESVSGVLIKRKKVDDFNWIPILYVPINDIEDFNIKFKDKTCAFNNTYEFAIVPLLNGIEGIYAISKVDCKSNRLVIVDENELWSTSITDGFCDTNRNSPSTIQPTLYSKYPHIIQNSKSDFDSISVSGMFLSDEEDYNECILYNNASGKECGHMLSNASKKFMDFLDNGNAKLLKNIDGRMFLCYTTTPPSDNAEEFYYKRKVSFGATEIGDYNNVADLYENGLIDSSASEQWW